jgi:hypothetical protein
MSSGLRIFDRFMEEVEVIGRAPCGPSAPEAYALYGLLLTEGTNPRIGIHWIGGNFPRDMWFLMPTHTNRAMLDVIAVTFPDKYQRVRDFLFPLSSKAA